MFDKRPFAIVSMALQCVLLVLALVSSLALVLGDSVQEDCAVLVNAGWLPLAASGTCCAMNWTQIDPRTGVGISMRPITCDTVAGALRITGLTLVNRNLTSSLQPVASLNALQLLNVSFNSLQGTLQPLANLTSLSILSVQYVNVFHGEFVTVHAHPSITPQLSTQRHA
jgi:hypothetical protein